MAEFKVRIEGIELSEQQHRAINASIQQAVLSHLSTFDFGSDLVQALRKPGSGPQVPDPEPSPVVVTPRWRGIVVEPR